jgi:hypothetical protein
MSRSYIFSPPQAPPWSVAGLLYFSHNIYKYVDKLNENEVGGTYNNNVTRGKYKKFIKHFGWKI